MSYFAAHVKLAISFNALLIHVLNNPHELLSKLTVAPMNNQDGLNHSFTKKPTSFLLSISLTTPL